MATNGTFQNTLTATVQGTEISTSFTGFARYSYLTHVNPIWASVTSTPSTCIGCHSGTSGGTSGLSLGGTAAQNYVQLTVNAAPTCDASLAAWRRASTDGGDNGHLFSVLRLLSEVVPNDVQGACGPHSTKPSAANLAIIRAWIRNNAPNN